MRLAWLTDIHLSFCPGRFQELLDRIDATDPDVVLIGGDVAEALDVTGYRERFATLDRPIYFVLGNHDFYHGSIRQVRAAVEDLCRRVENLHYLSSAGVVELTAGAALIGHDGWGDARVGDFDNSDVALNDYRLIEELTGIDQQTRKRLLNALGDEAADHVRSVLPEALERYQQVWFLTNVPPWREACWHEGRNSDADWTPHMACGAVGEALTEIMAEHPDRSSRCSVATRTALARRRCCRICWRSRAGRSMGGRWCREYSRLGEWVKNTTGLLPQVRHSDAASVGG